MTATYLAKFRVLARRSTTEAESGTEGTAAVGMCGRVEGRFLRVYWRVAVALTRDRSAVTALEYGLIAGLIAVVIIAAVKTVGSDLNSTFTTISSHFVNGTVT